MNKKLWKKALTAVLTAALLMTNSGITSMNASAAEKIYIEGVYTNFQKATMSTGTTKQIKAYVEPEDATNQKLQYRSSNSKVATVSSTGLITAVTPGTATITVKALDGSSQVETIKVTVLKDLILTSKNVDQDNDIIVLDKTYGNVTIDSSVGDANIYLAGINVKNKLTLGSGDYTVTLYDSTANLLIFDEVKKEIVSFAVTNEDSKAPKLNVGANTTISEIQAKINAMIKQEDGSQIDGIRFDQDQNGSIIIYLEGYNGNLLLDASLGSMEIIANGCNISSVQVSGGDKAGNIKLSNGGASTIDNVTLTGAAKLELEVPTNEVNIDKNSAGSFLTTRESVGTINNAGSNSRISVAGSVDNFTTVGANADIEVNKGGYVGTIQLNGTGTKLYGTGEVSEAYVNADKCRVNTINTLVTIGNVDGTIIQDKEAKGGSSVTTKTPVSGGGGAGSGDNEPEKPIKKGDFILKNDFEDGKYGLSSVMGSLSMMVVDGGKDSNKALKVSGKTASWNGVGFDFGAYLGKHITVRIKADIKAEKAGALKATIATNLPSPKNYQGVGEIKDAEANTWYTLEGTFELGNDITSAKLYFESPDVSNYYLDNVSITVESIGDAIRVTGVELDPSEAFTLDIGETKELKAIVSPADADNKGVTWSSDKPDIATVENGIVKGVKKGTAIITVTTVDGGLKDKCEVTVTDNVKLALNHKTVILKQIGESRTVKANVTDGIVWESKDTSVATVENGIITAKKQGTTAVIAKLGDKTVSCDVIVDENIIFYEDFEDGSHDLKDTGNEGWRPIKVKILTNEQEAYNGSSYLEVENTSGYNGFLITLDNTDGTKEAIFNITAFVKAVSKDFGIEFFWDDSMGSTRWTINGVTAKTTDWTKLRSNDIKVAAGKVEKIRLIKTVSGTFEAGIYYMDDLYITKTMAGGSGTPTTGTTIFSNSFEDETTYGMLGAVGTGITFETGGANNSGKCIKVVPSTAGWGNPGYSLNAYKGKTVSAIAFVKHTDEGSKQIKVTMNTNGYPQIAVTAESGVWTVIKKEFTIPADAADARLYFEKGEPAPASFYLDNVLIYEGTLSEAETEYAKLFPIAPTVITLTNASSPIYGLSIAPSAVSGSALTVDGVQNVVAISGGAIKAAGDWKIASISIGEECVGKTVSISAKVRRNTAGNLAWQLNSDGYPSVVAKWGVSADTWYELSGSLEVPKACQIYLSNHDDPSNYAETTYYLSDVVITIK